MKNVCQCVQASCSRQYILQLKVRQGHLLQTGKERLKVYPFKAMKRHFGDIQAPFLLQVCYYVHTTGGSCLMLLLGPGKKTHQPKIAVTKFLFYVRSNKIFSPKNRISQILVIVLKNRSNEIRSNEIRIRQELPVIVMRKYCLLWTLKVVYIRVLLRLEIQN